MQATDISFLSTFPSPTRSLNPPLFSHRGLEAIVTEYVRTILFGTLIPKLAMLIVYGITAVMLGGLYYLIFNDMGMVRAFWKIWNNMKIHKKHGKDVEDGKGPKKCAAE